MDHPTRKIRSLRARGVVAPMSRPLATAGGSVAKAPLALVDLETDHGVTGRSYVFCYTPLAVAPIVGLINGLGEALRGEHLAPARLMEGMQARFRLLGLQGPVMMAASGIEMAAWDALARIAGLPLCRLLGAEPVPVPAYNSKGLGIIGAAKAADEAVELADELRAGLATRGPEEARALLTDALADTDDTSTFLKKAVAAVG